MTRLPRRGSGMIEALLLGQVATTVAVIAVAAIGLTLLTGHVPLRRGPDVIVR